MVIRGEAGVLSPIAFVCRSLDIGSKGILSRLVARRCYPFNQPSPIIAICFLTMPHLPQHYINRSQAPGFYDSWPPCEFAACKAWRWLSNPDNNDLSGVDHATGFIAKRCLYYLIFIGTVVGFLRIMRWVRLRQELRTDLGATVYITSHSDYRRFQHQCLVVNNIKYEVREDKVSASFYWKASEYIMDADEPDETVYRRSWQNKMFGSCMPWLVNRREIPRWNSRLLGWTNADHEEILRTCAEVWNENPQYSELFNNCQHFARNVVDRIVPDDQRAFYSFWWYKDAAGNLRRSPILETSNPCLGMVQSCMPCVACL
ncbi:hypothetical protein QBC37DRAFT_356362 [Rhypophila decipiens]|uniref:Uncharacterized protein n=1 Tax=Rhypophila decipiens TaxID=261697 RepID=A0AAN6XUG2_9PEZI|nr:hypothetical protein QBC37DRAFT_356362 [Rhypophila decipiens]